MSIQIVRFHTDTQHIAEVEEAIGRVFGPVTPHVLGRYAA